MNNAVQRCEETNSGNFCKNLDDYAEKIRDENIMVVVTHVIENKDGSWPPKDENIVFLRITLSTTRGCPPQPAKAGKNDDDEFDDDLSEP